MPTIRPAIDRSIRQLGRDIARARRVRRMSTEDFAERMGVSRSTLARLERGDSGISIGNLAAALQALGELDRLRELVNPARDDAGLLLSGQTIPQRIRRTRRYPHVPSAAGRRDESAW